MGVSLTQYRIVIGVFNSLKIVKSEFSISINLLTLNSMFICFVIMMLLLCSGRLELNPGPVIRDMICRNLNMCHINIRSLSRSKVKAIQCQLSHIYDIITLSETHLYQGVTDDLFELPGFHTIVRKDRPNLGGGVAIYLKENLGFKRLFKYERADLEILWVQLNTVEGKLVLGSVYRPPGAASTNQFWLELDAVLDIIKSDGYKNIFLLGDFNADFKTINGKKLIDLCNRQNLECLIGEPTRITSSSATILDQIITNVPNFVNNVKVLPPVSTNDHCTVTARLNFSIPSEHAYSRLVWDYKKANIQGFQAALSEMNCDEIFADNNDIDKAADLWTEAVLNIAKQCIPNKTITVRPRDTPWYTTSLRLLKRKMMRAFYKFRKFNKLRDWNLYRALNCEYHNKLDEAESSHTAKLSSSLASNRNTKQWWTTVKWLLGKGGDVSYPCLDVNGTTVSDCKEKAQHFNNFFLSHSKIDATQSTLPNSCFDPPSFVSVEATEDEVFDLLKSLDVSKATGHDGISPRMLHMAGHSIVPSLTKLINLSLKHSKVPRIWKIANVLPLFKKGDRSDMNNYRPVSVLPCASKILERIVFKNVFNYFRDNHLLSPHQSGFMPGDSTVNQLTYLYHIFAKALDERKKIQIVFCDISKAFDRCWHDGILFKLQTLGVGGHILSWFKDYLSNRRQRVLVRGQSSSLGLIEAGVPQGSVLGPLLFLVYINDLPSGIQSNIKLFADDATLYLDFMTDDVGQDTLNRDLNYIQLWADKWLMKFSPTKTKTMGLSLTRGNFVNNMKLNFNGTDLENVDSHKHLGLLLTRRLNWSPHINYLLTSVSKISDVLKMLKYKLDRKSLETIYFAFIRPKLEYASQVWDNCNKEDCDSLEIFQQSLARVVTGARRGTSTKLLYEEVGWETLQERREATKFKSFKNIVDKKAPNYLSEILPNTVGDKRLLRNPEHFQLINCRTETFRNSFMPSSVMLWNEKRNYFLNRLVTFANPLYYLGNRETSMKLAQLRMECSKLNAHLVKLHVSDSANCSCGFNYEDTNHYLLDCRLFANERATMLQKISVLGNIEINVETLTKGSNSLDFRTNSQILDAVLAYIDETNRL